MLSRRLILTVLAFVAADATLSAQEIVDRDLAKPVAILKEEFKTVRSIRELRDGRVLIVDGGEPRLVLADFTSGKIETPIKVGAEDNEARSFGLLWAWPGDSTVSLDAGKGRIMVFGPNGAIARVAALGPAGAAPPPGGLARAPRLPTLRYLVGTESVIGMGVSARPTAPLNPASAPARMPYPVIRFSLRTMRFDTIVQLMPAQAPRAPLQSNTVGTYTAFVATTPLQSVDVWAAYPDGMVAVVRAASYRIEWFAADGARSSTEPVTFLPVPVTAGDRKRVVDEFKRTADVALQANPNRTAILAVNYDEPTSWPTTHPPFRSDLGPHVDPRDRLWLATRCLKDESATCYDVIDRLGMRIARYKLPPRTVIAGFGKDVIYTFNESKGQLQRHPFGDAP